MFGWRKKPEGFEWHKYVRTTVKLRRENRRRRLEDVRVAAIHQAEQAGAALAAGSRAAGAAARDGAVAGLGIAALTAQRSWAAGADRARVALQKLSVRLRPLTEVLERPKVGGPIALAAVITLGSGIGRYGVLGADTDTLIALALGVILSLGALPMLARVTEMSLPRFPSFGVSPRLLVGALAILAVSGIAWFVSRGGTDMATLGSQVPFFGSAKPVEGRAQAVSGDLLRIGGKSVRLSGIEAPEAEQKCGKGNKQWRCGAAAQSALARLVGSRTVRCTIDSTDGSGRSIGTCTVGTTDLGAELVRKGHVFADSGFFARYSSQQQEAQAAKAGLWSGEAERPGEYRAKAWDEAKRKAPEGCPIKGLVRDGDRIYLLPGSADYERGRVQKARGERWFCSEREAISAGFKAADRI